MTTIYRYLAGSIAAGSIRISNPARYQIFQRAGATGSITLSGTYTLGIVPTAIEARWNGGAWTTVDASPSGGAWTGSLSGLTPGQGRLEVRIANAPTVNAAVDDIGVGDVFLVAGQSNAAGSTTNTQNYTHATLKASNYNPGLGWRNLSERSVWPLVATYLMADQSVPVAFIKTAVGSTSSDDWLPATDTLYAAMLATVITCGSAPGMCLWWQGETDAGAGVAEAIYNANLDTIVDSIKAELGVNTMVCKLQNCTGPTPTNLAKIQDAIVTAWGDNANVLTGPDLSDITTDDAYHIQNDINVAIAAGRWADRILA